MATIIEALEQGVSNYPVPPATLHGVALARGIELEDEITVEMITSKHYRLADADIKLWVSTAPNVSQAGIAFDMLVSTRDTLKAQANAVYKELGDSRYVPDKPSVRYGYKGSRL